MLYQADCFLICRSFRFDPLACLVRLVMTKDSKQSGQPSSVLSAEFRP
jgi:hypothetical protein